jgi:hypothetical protein
VRVEGLSIGEVDIERATARALIMRNQNGW